MLRPPTIPVFRRFAARGRANEAIRPGPDPRSYNPHCCSTKLADKQRERVAEVVGLRLSRVHSVRARGLLADDVASTSASALCQVSTRILTRSSASGSSPRPRAPPPTVRVLREGRRDRRPRKPPFQPCSSRLGVVLSKGRCRRQAVVWTGRGGRRRLSESRPASHWGVQLRNVRVGSVPLRKPFRTRPLRHEGVRGTLTRSRHTVRAL
jgi:hypothetical protein